MSRTGDDLVRYHGKMMIVDREELHVYGFNYTAVDLKSRSFGLVTRDRKMVKEALRLFEADARPPGVRADGRTASSSAPRTRASSSPRSSSARRSRWRSTTRRSPTRRCCGCCNQKAKAGVDVRVIGKVGKRGGSLRVQKLPGGASTSAR